MRFDLLNHYDHRRSYAALDQWLGAHAERFHGVLITDGYCAYHQFAEDHPRIEAHGGCWSHCRRKFADAVKGRHHGSDAEKILKRIAVIYQLEKRLGERRGADRAQARQ